GLEFLTFDSSAVDFNAKNRVLVLPSSSGLHFEHIEERERKTSGDSASVEESIRLPATHYMMNKCSCLSCAWLREDFPDGPPRDGTYLSQRMLYHNVLTYRTVFTNIHRACEQDPERVLRNMLGTRYGSVLRAFEGQ